MCKTDSSVLYFQIRMINKKEPKEEKALSDLYRFGRLSYRLCGLSTVLLKKKKNLNKAPIAHDGKTLQLFKVLYIKSFFKKQM